jgi:hypothetical protein
LPERVVVDLNITSEHGRIGSETPSPEAIADYSHRVPPARSVILRRKGPADLHTGANDAEIIARDQFSTDSRDLFVRGRIHGQAEARRRAIQNIVAAEVRVERVREPWALLLQDA